ncbi:MAG: hypothetical protein ABI890_06405 [Lapillicoccus sp.]
MSGPPRRGSRGGSGLAAEMGDRRRDDGLAAVFTSDLARAVEMVEIAFAGSEVPVLADCGCGSATTEISTGRQATRCTTTARSG